MNAENDRITRQHQDDVLALVASGKSLRLICARAGMPAASTVSTWVRFDRRFRAAYRKAALSAASGVSIDAAHLKFGPMGRR